MLLPRRFLRGSGHKLYQVFVHRISHIAHRRAAKMKSLTLHAPAKINLYLDVLNKRKDSYHNIRTIFQKIDLHDTVKVGIIDKGISIDCQCPGVPNNRANIAYKAAQLMKREFGLEKGVGIQIKKRIPHAAGLGGGSSDAASVIIAINKLFRLDIPDLRLVKLAKIIGADVPFFVSGYNCALGTGIGDRLKEIRRRQPLHILLLLPGLKIYTKTVYNRVNFPLTKPGPNATMLAHALAHNSNIGRLLYNRLEGVVLPAYPIVREAKAALSLHGAQGVLLSGSGPTVFAIYNTRKEAIKARDRFKRDKRWKLFLTRTT